MMIRTHCPKCKNEIFLVVNSEDVEIKDMEIVIKAICLKCGASMVISNRTKKMGMGKKGYIG